MGKDVLRNCLAWLSVSGLAEPYREGKVAWWRERTTTQDHAVPEEAPTLDEDPLEEDY